MIYKVSQSYAFQSCWSWVFCKRMLDGSLQQKCFSVNMKTSWGWAGPSSATNEVEVQTEWLLLSLMIWRYNLLTLDKNENGVQCIKWINKWMELNEMNEAMNEIKKWNEMNWWNWLINWINDMNQWMIWKK